MTDELAEVLTFVIGFDGADRELSFAAPNYLLVRMEWWLMVQGIKLV